MRAVLSLGVVGGIVAALLCVPLPYYVAATFEIQPRDAPSVYVEVPGELREVILHSGAVAAGQAIAKLDDCQRRLVLERLVSQRSELEARVESIRQRAHTDDSALLELSQTEEALTQKEKALALARQKEDEATKSAAFAQEQWLRAEKNSLSVMKPALWSKIFE